MRAALPRWAEGPVLLALGLVLVYGAMIPIAPGAARASPDLVYCLVIAWVARRAATPLWLVLILGIVADLMLSRPVGLGALGLVLAAEVMRGRAAGPFLVEWGMAMLSFALMLAGIVLILRLSFFGAPEMSALIWHVAATAVAYPLVAAGSGWLVRGAR